MESEDIIAITVRYLTASGIVVRPEVYPPSAAPEATRVSKDERKEMRVQRRALRKEKR
jgi:hypothetical protein